MVVMNVKDDLTAYRWLIEHEYTDVKSFLNDTEEWDTHSQVFRDMLLSPMASYRLILQHNMTNDEKYKLMLRCISKPGTIIVVVGAKGSGKTACVTGKIVPDLMSGKYTKKPVNVAYCGMPQTYPSFLKYHSLMKGDIIFRHDYLSVPSHYVAIQDESAIIENAKNHNVKTQKEREDILPIIRHKDLSILYISQQLMLISKKVRDMVDGFIVKPFSLMQLLKENSDTEFPFPPVVRRFIPTDNNSLLFIHPAVGILIIKHDIYSFYKDDPDKWGKSFKNITDDSEAVAFIDALLNNGYKPGDCRHLLRLRGWDYWNLDQYKERADYLGVLEN